MFVEVREIRVGVEVAPPGVVVCVRRRMPVSKDGGDSHSADGCCSKGGVGTLLFSLLCIGLALLSSSQRPGHVLRPSGAALTAQGAGNQSLPKSSSLRVVSATPRQRSWRASPPPATEYCESRGRGRALVVMLGPVASGRTLENAIRNVAAPLCAWTVLVDVVDDARKCKRQPQPQAAEADTEALLARVAAEVEPASLRESLGPKLEALGSARHLVSEDRRECGHIDHPPPPLPLRHFGWEVHAGPCVEGSLPAAARDGAVTSFRRGDGLSWSIHGGGGGNDSAAVAAWLPGLMKRVREATFGTSDRDPDESTVIDVRGAADFAVVGGLTQPEREEASKFDGAQMGFEPKVEGADAAGQPLKARFPVDPPMAFAPQNSIDDTGRDEPAPNPLVRGTLLNVTARPVPRLAPSIPLVEAAKVLRKACPSPAQTFCQGNAFPTCVRRARWLAQTMLSIDEQDSFGDRVAFADRDPNWTPTSGDDDALLSFPAPRPRIRPLPKTPSSSRPSPRCAASPPGAPNNGGSAATRSLALLYTGQLRTGRTVLPASLKQLAGNSLSAFLAISVPSLNVAREQLQFFHKSPDVPLAGMFLLNGTRTLDLREDKAEYPHPRSWKTIPLLTTNNIVSQHYMLLAASTMMYLYEQRCDVRFDFIVRTRPDSLYRWPLPPSALPRLYPGVFVADKGWDYENGLSDQFVFGPAWLIGNFLDVAAVYPQTLVEQRLPFTQVEMIHRFTMEALSFPYAKLVRTSRRVTFLVREDQLHLSAMHRQVLASLNATLPPPCRPKPGVKVDGHAIRFIDDAPFCELRAPPPAPTRKAGQGR